MNCLLSNRLAECRAAKGINKSQLAYRLKKSRAYVTRLERGDIKPSIEVALGLARYFGKTVEFIFQLVEGDANQTNFPSVPGSRQEHQTMPETTKTKIQCN